MPDDSPEHKAHMKIIERCMKRRHSRRPANVVDRIRADDPAFAAALLERMQKAGFDRSARPRPPPTEKDYRNVTLPVVEWWAVRVDEFAAQQGITPEKFMSAILSEGLYEVYLEFMAQRNDAARIAARKHPTSRRLSREAFARAGGGDLDDDIPF